MEFFVQSTSVAAASLLAICVAVSVSRLSKSHRPAASRISQPMLIAHKGGATDAPENTLAAIKMAHRNGAQGVEIDIMLTEDKKAVLHHDETVDRTTDGEGRISQMKYEELKVLNAAHHFEGWEDHEVIPLLSDVVHFCLENDLFIFFDVKSSDQHTIEELRVLFDIYPELYEKSTVSAFNYGFLIKMHWLDPKIHVTPIYGSSAVSKDCFLGKYLPSFAVKGLAYVMFYHLNRFFFPVDIISVQHNLVDSRYTQYWGPNIHIVTWTVNEAERKEQLKEKLRVSVISDKV